jgi:hypothetical protein
VRARAKEVPKLAKKARGLLWIVISQEHLEHLECGWSLVSPRFVSRKEGFQVRGSKWQGTARQSVNEMAVV